MATRRVFEAGKTALKLTLAYAAAATAVNIYRRRQRAMALPDQFVLEIDLENTALVETLGPFDLQSALSGNSKKLEFRQAVEAIEQAGRDSRVKAIFTTLGESSKLAGLAHVQELRQAFHRFREATAGRVRTVAYADCLGEGFAGGMLSFYLAAASEKVYMQPTGLLSATGLAITSPFLRPLFDKWHVKPTVVKREEYKNAGDLFTESGYTPEHRLATEELLRGFMGQMLAGISADRNISPDEAKAAVDASPLTCTQAVQRRLVDGAKYRDEAAEEAGGTEPSLPRIPLAKYSRIIQLQKARERTGRLWEAVTGAQDDDDDTTSKDPAVTAREALGKKPAIGLIRASGPIVLGQGTPPSVRTPVEVASRPLCKLLEAARKDASIKAVVLRVDSPGGSAVASDAIHREVQLLKSKGKPVVVSMGNVAASGGYYIAAPATAIVAEPGTITGSIGVVASKLDVGTLLRDQGVQVETIAEGRNAAAMLPFGGLDGEQLQQLNATVDWIYDGFLERVAQGRNLPLPQVRELARGRIWTGEAAHGHRLVDRLGGLADAVRLAKQHAGLSLEADADVEVRELGERRPIWQQLAQAWQADSSAALAATLMVAAAAAGSPDIRWLADCAQADMARAHAGPQMRCLVDAHDVR